MHCEVVECCILGLIVLRLAHSNYEIFENVGTNILKLFDAEIEAVLAFWLSRLFKSCSKHNRSNTKIVL